MSQTKPAKTPKKTPKKTIKFTFEDNETPKKTSPSKKRHKKSKTNALVTQERNIRPKTARRNSISKYKKNALKKKRSASNSMVPVKLDRHHEDDSKTDASEGLLSEFDLFDISQKEQIKDLFKSFQEALKKQEKVLLKKFESRNLPDSKLQTAKLAPILSNKDQQDSETSKAPVDKPVLYIDNKGVLKYISKIGMIKGKKFEELTNEQDMAIDKLKQIIQYEEQIKSEHAKALKLKQDCEKEYQECELKKKKVEKALEEVQPLIDKAKKAVSSIEKSAMDELRSLRKPPDVVKAVIECSIYMVRTELKKNWIDTKKLVSFKFVKEVLAFDTMKLCEKEGKKKVDFITKNWLGNPEFTFKRANECSKVAGPMVTWIYSQIEYAEVLVKVKPLIDEIKELEEKLKFSELEVKRVEALDIKLQKKIKICRGEMLEMVGYRKIGDRYFM